MVTELTVSELVGLVFGASLMASLVALILQAMVADGIRGLVRSLSPRKEGG